MQHPLRPALPGLFFFGLQLEPLELLQGVGRLALLYLPRFVLAISLRLTTVVRKETAVSSWLFSVFGMSFWDPLGNCDGRPIIGRIYERHRTTLSAPIFDLHMRACALSELHIPFNVWATGRCQSQASFAVATAPAATTLTETPAPTNIQSAAGLNAMPLHAHAGPSRNGQVRSQPLVEKRERDLEPERANSGRHVRRPQQPSLTTSCVAYNAQNDRGRTKIRRFSTGKAAHARACWRYNSCRTCHQSSVLSYAAAGRPAETVNPITNLFLKDALLVCRLPGREFPPQFRVGLGGGGSPSPVLLHL